MAISTQSLTPPQPDSRNQWPTVRFGDVVRDVKVKVDPFESELERYVAGEHMETDDLHIRKWGTIGDGYLGPAFHRKFVVGQTLYGSRRTYLRKVAVAEFDGVCANTTFVFEPKDERLIPELLPFVMQTDAFVQHSMQQSRGSTNPYVTFKDLAWYEFPLPPLDEQRRIAEILWAADAAVEKYKLAYEKLRKFTIKLFEILIIKYEEETNQKFLTMLDDAILEIIAGKSYAGSSEAATLDEAGVLKVSAIGDGVYNESENKALLKQSNFLTGLEVKPGYLLVTRSNASRAGVGRACIVPSTRSRLMLSDKTLRLVVDEKQTTAKFLLYSLRSKKFRRYIEYACNGTEAKNISQNQLRKAPIFLPPLSIQREIAIILKKQEQAVMRCDSHLRQLISFKCRLLTDFLKS